MLDSNIASELIKEYMPVVGADLEQIGVVHHLQGKDAIQLALDSDGKHHFIPLTWVSAVDDKVHLDRSSRDAIQAWSELPLVVAPYAAPRPPEHVEHEHSADAATVQPIVARVQSRRHELETALDALPADGVRERRDLELAIGTIDSLLTGDLDHVPSTVAADMSRWLEQNKHLATVQSAPVAAPMAPITSNDDTAPQQSAQA